MSSKTVLYTKSVSKECIGKSTYGLIIDVHSYYCRGWFMHLQKHILRKSK